jgi:hypothetical protein
MKALRLAILWAVLAAIFLMAVLSIIGAFMGANGARELFNSPPLIVFWFGLAALYFGTFLFWVLRAALGSGNRRLPGPGGMAMHLGTILVLGGAMWGSVKGHELRTAWLGVQKVPQGLMPIGRGEEEDRIFDGGSRTEIATLPFSLYLKDFWIEYYPDEGKPWFLVVVAPATAERPEHQIAEPWDVGREIPVPFTRVRLKVLRYIPKARPAAGGGAVEDRKSDVPAMEILLSFEGREERCWLIPEPGADQARLPLGNFIRNVPPDEGRAEGPDLYLARPAGAVKAYKSDVVVRDARGRRLASKVIEVNDPLHYGGYHFYQHSYDTHAEQYTVLQVVSDSGLAAAYLGFFLLVMGTFWQFWGEPAWARLLSKT